MLKGFKFISRRIQYATSRLSASPVMGDARRQVADDEGLKAIAVSER
jgi:hypothetical protein